MLYRTDSGNEMFIKCHEFVELWHFLCRLSLSAILYSMLTLYQRWVGQK